jgi:hypothetical protein
MKNPSDIIKGEKYKSNMLLDEDIVYLGCKEYGISDKKYLIIINHPESNWIGTIIPNDTNNPIWKKGFQLL